MTDRIDPGPGWRLLKVGERKPRGYEYKSPVFGWTKGDGVGQRASADGFPCRIRITPRTTKAIATRATVRAVFRDGAVTDDSMTCGNGLSEQMMHYAIRRWTVVQGAAKAQGAKYIMLEIQREGEP